MTFASRQDAGCKLGCQLLERRIQPDLILGLPRGGIIVAGEVAKILQCPLDVVVVRKIGHPDCREFAVGALAAHGIVVLDQPALNQTRVAPEALEAVIAEEAERLVAYQLKFERGSRMALAGKRVLVVDDGLATGASAEAAVRSVEKQGAQHVIVAVPVASANGFARLVGVSDEVIALLVDPDFEAVGQYYGAFSQTTDDEVLAVLRSCP